jgi:preprotein translocase subunit SecA
MGFLDKIFGDPNQKEIKKLEPIVGIINNLEKDFEKLSDKDLQNKTQDFKTRLSKNESIDSILPEAFATVREAGKRALGQRHYDVQIMAGIVLHQGKIAEMKTGEGKTLVATLPLYLNALSGKGCHLVAPNDYLSRVGGGWMASIYNFLGLSVGIITHDFSAIYDPEYLDPHDHGDDRLNHWRPVSRIDAYKADITYGTNNEFGFDYLRDNMATDISQVVQRPFNYVIVDEVDSILIDEARTPLIISAPAEESASLYQKFAGLVPTLDANKDYKVDEKDKAVKIMPSGIKKMEGLLGIENIYNQKGVKYVYHLEEALKAHYLFKKDKEYVVKDGEIVIVDEFTGRLMHGRRYSGGLHQAIEAKEKVEVKRESNTLATISFQNLFRMYPKLAGMTGTAATEAEEFGKIYNLDVIEIPTNRSLIRKDLNDQIYKSEEGKYNAIIEEIKTKNKQGQPVLVGTISIEKNEYLSRLLKRNGIRHNVLNAKHHEQEAKIIAQAGKKGAVTLATNMAGRGVDIILGGDPPKDLGKSVKQNMSQWQIKHKEVLDTGGLCVIGTERHESRRIDNQLRGRAGRQGDPGETKFFVSMQDDLMRIFGGEKIGSMMEKLGLPEDQPIGHPLITRSIEQAQRKVEGHNFDIRKHLVEYDDVMNKHREVVYRKRKKILILDPQKDKWLHEEIQSIMSDKESSEYDNKIGKIGIDKIRQLEKMVYLKTIDLLWIEHLNTMTELREGIGLRGYGQRDPLLEYKQEAYHIFQKLISRIEDQVVKILTKIQINENVNTQQEYSNRQNIRFQGADQSLAGGAIKQPTIAQPNTNMYQTVNKKGVTVRVRQASQDSDDNSPQTTYKTVKKVGRNEPCPCKSGKKYKKCCGK